MDRRDVIRAVLAALGAGASSSVARAVLSADFAPAAAPRAAVLSDDLRRMVAAIAEHIIPKTDTPGAIEAGVPQFIELIVSDWYTAAERRRFLDGVTALNTECLRRHSHGFLECSAEQQVAALRDAEATALRAALEPGERGPGRPFFTEIKALTVLGYYTSQAGATEELRYNPVPARFDGDFPFSRVGRQWSS